MDHQSRIGVLRLGLLAAVCCAALTLWGSGIVLRQSGTDSVLAEQSIVSERVSNPTETELTLRTHQGVVSVYQGSLLLYETDIPVDSLPEADRKLLSSGIKVRNELELQRFLEDFGA